MRVAFMRVVLFALFVVLNGGCGSDENRICERFIDIDAAGLDAKRAFIVGKGARAISVWHLGGNAWFTN